MTDIRQSKEYALFLQQIGWESKKIAGHYFYIKRIPILGAAIKLQRTKTIPFNTIEKISKAERAFQVIIETEATKKLTGSLLSHKYKLSKTPYLPTKTLQIDITKSEKLIISQMKKDARYSLRKSSGLTIKEEKNIKKFRDQWFDVIGHKRHVLPLSHLMAFKKAFGNNMVLFTWEKESGGMFLKANDMAYYWIGFTSNNARNRLAQYQVIWKGIRWAKRKGAETFDFEGVYDERFPISGWQGFTHFKKSFGGKVITYPGSFVKWRLPI